MKIPLIGLIALLQFGCAHSTVDREAIRNSIRAQISHFQDCYANALKRNKDLEGKIIIKWQIIDNGLVKGAQVQETTIQDQVFAGCMVDIISKIKFEAPPEGQIAEVVYPFTFKFSDDRDVITSSENSATSFPKSNADDKNNYRLILPGSKLLPATDPSGQAISAPSTVAPATSSVDHNDPTLKKKIPSAKSPQK